MVTIYVLELESNKYYIGKSNNHDIRINDHDNGIGSEWTKKYKPIKIKEIIHNCDMFDEQKYTKKYMYEYGIENVRGGSYVQINLKQKYNRFIK